MQGPLQGWQVTRHLSQRIFNQLEQKGPHNPKRVATNKRERESEGVGGEGEAASGAYRFCLRFFYIVCRLKVFKRFV